MADLAGRLPGHCGGSGGPCIAAHTRARVQGMSMWSTPCASCRASITAFTIAGGDPTFGDSPTPFAPSGWCGHGVTVWPSSKSGHSSADFELGRSEEHTSELQSRPHLVCRLLL